MKGNNNPNQKLQEKLETFEFPIPESSWERMNNILYGHQPVPTPPTKPTASWFRIKALSLSGLLIASASIGLLATSIYILKSFVKENSKVQLSSFYIPGKVLPSEEQVQENIISLSANEKRIFLFNNHNIQFQL
jgi:hypothetical protein